MPPSPITLKCGELNHILFQKTKQKFDMGTTFPLQILKQTSHSTDRALHGPCAETFILTIPSQSGQKLTPSASMALEF